jgi:hypothetical protein
MQSLQVEKLPDSVKTKGFQRTIELPCVYGFPKYDISEIANSAGLGKSLRKYRS